MSTKTLDWKKPFGEISGNTEGTVVVPPGSAQRTTRERRPDIPPEARFSQEGELYDTQGKHVGADPAGKPDAPTPDSGKDIAKGQFDDYYKPLEEGGGGGGQTQSYPQSTDKGRDVVKEHDEAEDKPDRSRR